MNSFGQNAPPEWLVDLENKREKKKGSRLGHEIGANAKCNVCDSCPGLDLHFWRKTCKNCKCRKEDHDIQDDEFSWAQFEILGQKKSKPGCKLNNNFIISAQVSYSHGITVLSS